MEAHLTRELPDPRNWIAGLPAGIGSFIVKATQKKPEDRYRNILEAKTALEELSRDLGLEGPAGITEDRKMLSLFLFYREAQRLGLNALLEEFSGKLREAGINLKAADFKDIG
jgi:hypothetical protein